MLFEDITEHQRINQINYIKIMLHNSNSRIRSGEKQPLNCNGLFCSDCLYSNPAPEFCKCPTEGYKIKQDLKILEQGGR